MTIILASLIISYRFWVEYLFETSDFYGFKSLVTLIAMVTFINFDQIFLRSRLFHAHVYLRAQSRYVISPCRMDFLARKNNRVYTFIRYLRVLILPVWFGFEKLCACMIITQCSHVLVDSLQIICYATLLR